MWAGRRIRVSSSAFDIVYSFSSIPRINTLCRRLMLAASVQHAITAADVEAADGSSRR
jgi:hypothetical protein